MTFHIGVDVGGTFTDLFALNSETGEVISEKADTTKDVVSGVLSALDQSRIEPSRVKSFVFGSTIATNALVERTMAPVAFLGTHGFTDILETRRLWREHLFGWKWDRPRSLVMSDLRFGIRGRIDWQGREIEPLDLAAVEDAVRRIERRGIRSIAVSFLFSFLNPAHEIAVRERILEISPDMKVTLSHEVNPEIKEYERASSTVIAAGLNPLIDQVLRSLEDRLSGHGIGVSPQVIKSNGGIMSTVTARRKPLELARSGPAGGVAAATRLSRELGKANVITVDIGGTTADVAVVTEGEAVYTQSSDLDWDIPIRVAMADVRSVGAGGGSIAYLDAAKGLHAGPRSAGASPGPVCYGRGGTEPTVTDAAVVAGLVDPDRFLGGRMKIDVAAAARAIGDRIAEPLSLSVQEAASGIVHLAAMRMAQLINEMTVQVGLDPRDYHLVGFGGAGPIFTAFLAEEISAKGAIVPHHPAVWSAFGGLFADVLHDYSCSRIELLRSVSADDMAAIAADLRASARADLLADGLDPETASYEYSLDLRYSGQSHELNVPVDLSGGLTRDAVAIIEEDFEARHEQVFAHRRASDPLQLVTVRLLVRVSRDLALPTWSSAANGGQAAEAPTRAVWFHGHSEAVETRIFDRFRLAAGETIDGPAVVEEDQSNTVVPPGMSLRVSDRGYLVIESGK